MPCNRSSPVGSIDFPNISMYDIMLRFFGGSGGGVSLSFGYLVLASFDQVVCVTLCVLPADFL